MPNIASAGRRMTVTTGQGISQPLNSTFANVPLNQFTATPWNIGAVFYTTFTQQVTVTSTPGLQTFSKQVFLSGFPTPLTLSGGTSGAVLASVSLAASIDASLLVGLPQIQLLGAGGSPLATTSTATTTPLSLQAGQTYNSLSLNVTFTVSSNGAAGSTILPVTLGVWAMLVGQSAQSNLVT
jgi:hypothetical protein